MFHVAVAVVLSHDRYRIIVVIDIYSPFGGVEADDL